MFLHLIEDLGVAVFTVDPNQSNAAGSSPNRGPLQFFDEDRLDVAELSNAELRHLSSVAAILDAAEW